MRRTLHITTALALACATTVLLPADDVVPEAPSARRVFIAGNDEIQLNPIEGLQAVTGREIPETWSYSGPLDLARLQSDRFSIVPILGDASAFRSQRTYPVYRDEATGSVVVALDEIAVGLPDGRAAGSLALWAADNGMEIVDAPQPLPAIAHLRIVDSSIGDAFAAADLAAASGQVEWAEPVLWVEAKRLAIPNDTLYFLQWHLDNQFGAGGGPPDVDIDAPEAWDITAGSDDMVFAILDDGVDLSHPDIRSWGNLDETQNAADSDANGYIDDVVGWDFVDGDNDPTPSFFLPPYDDMAHSDIHGTPVAGLVAAQGSNETGVSGVSQRGQIMSLRVLSAGRLVSPSDHASAIVYAANNGADVINMSYALPFSSREVEQAMIHALTTGRGGLGTPIFAAAGDESIPGVRWPAASPWTAAVGALTSFDTLPAQAPVGERLTFVAPSVSDVQGTATTDVSIEERGFDDLSDEYTLMFGGTSASTAMASGLAGLILTASPELTWWEVYQVMSETTDAAPPGSAGDYILGHSNAFGWGRLSAGQALARTLDPTPVEDFYEPNNDLSQLPPLPTPFFQHLILREPDLFVFEAQGNEYITAHLWHLPSQPAPTLQLQGLNGSPILTAAPVDSGLELNFLNSGGVTQPLVIAVDPAPGGTPLPYTLWLRNRPLDSYEPNDVIEDAPLLPPSPSMVISAQIEPLGDVDIYAISGTAGDTVTIETTARRLATPSPLDSVLTLYRSDGVTPLAISDDHLRYDSLIETTLPASETCYIVVRDYFGDGGADYQYTLSISGFTASTGAASQGPSSP